MFKKLLFGILIINNFVNSVYITEPLRCSLTYIAKKNIDKVQLISIDTHPGNHKYLKYIRPNIQIPTDSEIEKKSCNIHSDHTMSGALGIKYNGKTPSLLNLRVNFIPGLLCTGAGYEPYLISSIREAVRIAKKNEVLGIKTVVIYSIGGTYNTQEKINTMKELTEVNGTYVVTVIGNHNYEQYDNCQLNFFKMIPELIIVGGTTKGKNLLNISMIGDCVRYYAPGDYKSPINRKRIIGTSFSAPIVGYLITNYLLNNPDSTKEQVLKFLDSKTGTVYTKTKTNKEVKMKVFRKKGACKFV